ncbi:transposase [[Clostridium] scindens]|uniref:Transposase n=1 Tax=Clostridium scindens (strain JCM 10418 / VPI 12708) TaxID=29347 RepID=A0A844F5M4_CLOSV|nr:transposase [[Clostridium] scindens]MSS41842.1 transposase [[Clostridium] scindens]NSI90596.1 transposase [[Clostridium] scindens]NSJ05250.1 transposase [[Clostridium] scindens]QRO38943.1 transposase [[Clostridium] scindens]
MYEKAAPYYSNSGRKSIDLKSERRLDEEVSPNLSYRWFCGIDLMHRVPDHSTFSQNRKRCFKDASILREIFNEIVLKCIETRTIMWISGNWFRRWI